MAQIPTSVHANLENQLAQLRDERYPWWNYWRDLARYILPRRYTYLDSYKEAADASSTSGNTTRVNRRATTFSNKDILDSTGTLAARTLASGMLNGITSPARPWFRLRIQGLPDEGPHREWLDIVQDRMLQAMGETNFYNALSLVYLDLGTFGSSAMMIYEDFEDIFRCYNFALGEYYFQQDNRHIVRTFAREFYWRVDQIVREFGYDNVPRSVQEAWDRGGGSLKTEHKIVHWVEPNDTFVENLGVPPIFQFREIYWIAGRRDGQVLRVRGFVDWPAVTPRWNVLGNDSYGTGPAADALPDIKQLQHMTKRKAQGLDKLISPPVVADIQLQNRPTALMPNGITYVAGTNNVGVKPLYTVDPPIAEINNDILRLQSRIRETFFNDLFKMISQLDTVRTATEIDARREEKLVLLGPVLERFENEALDPALSRIFTIMQRRGLFPPPPPEIAGLNIEVQYVSVLQDAQRAVGAAPIERFASFIGNVGGVVPDVLEVPDWEEMTRDYAKKIGVESGNLRDREEVQRTRQLRQTLQSVQAAGEAAQPAANAAQTAAETEVDGQSLLRQLTGGGNG